jgi:hypothetical protein
MFACLATDDFFRSRIDHMIVTVHPTPPCQPPSSMVGKVGLGGRLRSIYLKLWSPSHHRHTAPGNTFSQDL